MSHDLTRSHAISSDLAGPMSELIDAARIRHACKRSTCVPRVHKHSTATLSTAEAVTASMRRGSAGKADQRGCCRDICMHRWPAM